MCRSDSSASDFGVITTPTPAQGQSLAVSLPDLAPLAGSPAAVILRVRGAAPTSTHLALALDGTTIADVILPPAREIRVDASMRPPDGAGHQLRVSGDGAGWEITYLEVGNVHGFSSGLLGFDIVPRERKYFRRAPWWMLVPMLVGLLALRPQPDWPRQAARRRVHRLGVGLVLLLFLAARCRRPPHAVQDPAQHPGVPAVRRGPLRSANHPGWVARSGRPRRRSPCERSNTGAGRRGPPGAVAARPWVPPTLAGVAAITVSAMALTLGAHYAGGADSYGYLAQSAWWARGQLYEDQPIAAELPSYVSDAVIVPLGFVGQTHSGVRGRIVPSYSPGLPMLMAPLRRVLGANAAFLVVPALAGLTVWLTFVLGRRLDSGATGLFAALWMASSPAFLSSSLSPLSDVPVTAWWLARVGRGDPSNSWLGGGRRHRNVAGDSDATEPGASGGPDCAAVCQSMVHPSRNGRRGVELVVFLTTASAGPAIVASLYNYWFGSPFTSGYGAASLMFSPSFILPNLARYPVWFVDTQTLVIVAGLAAPFLLHGRPGAPDKLQPATAAWLLLTLSLLVWGAYVVYYFFDAWWYLRFLLPSYPPLIVLASTTCVFALRRTLAPRTLGTILLVLIAAHGVQFSRKEYLFSLARGEARYERVGEFAARALPEGSLLLSMQHSGSLRYYSGLTTLRYDLTPPDRLDDLVAHFEARGRRVYIVLDEWEKQEFRGRFAPNNALGALDWTPFAVSSGGMAVTIYDPRDRMSPRPVATQIIP